MTAAAQVQGALPLGGMISAEDQRLFGRHHHPVVALDLGFELARAPARIAEQQQAEFRTGAAGDGAHDLRVRRQHVATVDREAVGLNVVG